MLHPDPNDRPSATEALAEFEAVVSTLNPRTLCARIWRQQDTLSARFSCFIFGWPLVWCSRLLLSYLLSPSHSFCAAHHLTFVWPLTVWDHQDLLFHGHGVNSQVYHIRVVDLLPSTLSCACQLESCTVLRWTSNKVASNYLSTTLPPGLRCTLSKVWAYRRVWPSNDGLCTQCWDDDKSPIVTCLNVSDLLAFFFNSWSTIGKHTTSSCTCKTQGQMWYTIKRSLQWNIWKNTFEFDYRTPSHLSSTTKDRDNYMGG